VQGVLERGQDVVLRLDVQGAATLRRLVPDCISIFIAAESERALAERLVARSTELPVRRFIFPNATTIVNTEPQFVGVEQVIPGKV
jgi:guanylate kinase